MGLVREYPVLMEKFTWEVKRYSEEIILVAKYFCFLMASNEDFNLWKIYDCGYWGRAVVEAMGLNPAGDLNDREYNVNQAREENSF